MDQDTSRRDFLCTGSAAAAGLLAGASVGQAADPPAKTDKNDKADPVKDYPRDHAGVGGPVGSSSDRGKLVPGRRSAADPPVLVETPDLPNNLPFKMVDGFKEFHLHAKPCKVELLPNFFSNHWGYDGFMPGPTIQVTEGDKVRVVLHNELPEATTFHLHGVEMACIMDGVPYVTTDPTPPGKTSVYEYHLHQTGTYFYHAHEGMEEAIGMVGLFIIHPKKAYEPAVDQDFALITQEFAIRPASNTPDSTSMDFSYFTFNGRCGPWTTPLICKLGNRVRIRLVNFSTDDHHPIHLHGHTFWVTGTEGGRIPETAWIPGNNVLVAVAQVREIEFIANNPGDWVMHCHMFHHMMNHMVSGVGPGSRGKAKPGQEDPRYKIPAYPQDAGMMAMPAPAEMKKIMGRKEVRGMRPGWAMTVMGLHTVVRVLPPELYDKVVSGKGDIAPGASVPGSMGGHMHMKMEK